MQRAGLGRPSAGLPRGRGTVGRQSSARPRPPWFARACRHRPGETTPPPVQPPLSSGAPAPTPLSAPRRALRPPQPVPAARTGFASLGIAACRVCPSYGVLSICCARVCRARPSRADDCDLYGFAPHRSVSILRAVHRAHLLRVGRRDQTGPAPRGRRVGVRPPKKRNFVRTHLPVRHHAG